MSEENKTPSEEILNKKWDLCISNLLVKTGIGLKKSWPIAMSTGFGIGVSYAECQRTFNPTAIPGVKIIKKPPTSSV
ncbi:7732_t:CDS:2 [Diversispora eburnea]|uniref:MICOS complex subunit MIC10 n=1 Tax=Diversispora eburnea TaxID=1213867 RepID=A0A9N8Z6D3_9GLOM|nr:7732_t:CDS:2 [Diversispora eburnea]